MFGKSFVRDYSSISLDSVNFVRELRDNSLCVPGFQTSELDLFACKTFCGRLVKYNSSHCMNSFPALPSWNLHSKDSYG